MSKNFKKILALVLAMVMLLPTLAGCKNNGGSENKPTEPPEEAKVLKILTLGHSLAVDSAHMLALVAAAENSQYENVVIGTLYYSGCPLSKHVSHLVGDTPAYDLYLSSTEKSNSVPTITEGVTMKYALNYEYWDVIVMQGGVFEIAEAETYTKGAIQTIQNYVKENVVNPLFTFAWHMPWAPPVDNALRDTFKKEPNSYYTNYEKYGHDRTTFFNALTKNVGDYIVTDDTFTCLIPTGTAIENALSSYLEEKDLHRDYVHTSDLGRLIAAYTYYCSLMGIKELKEIKLDAIPKSFLKKHITTLKWTLTDHEKALVLESVNNALKEPLKMTQSQFTTAPA